MSPDSGLQFAENKMQKGRFAHAIAAHQADFVAVR